MIEAEKLKKSYGDKIVLDISSLIIKQSQIISICGPSGAGKTTLLSILGTLMKADNQKETSLKIMNEEITTMSINYLAKFRNKNLSFELLNKSIKKFNKNKKTKYLKAHINNKNIASKKIFEKNNFQFYENINNFGVYKLKLN